MKPTSLLCAFVLSTFLPVAHAADDEGFAPMFNGKDLSGWVNANCAPETWSIKDGVVSCTGVPTGAMRTEKQYENFIMECEWRHLTSGGNSGVFIWGSPISAPGVPFLRGIEVQVLDQGYMKHADPTKPRWFTTHGDVFPIHGATMEPHGEHSGQRSFPSEERSKPSPEWNHYRITGNNGTLTLAVNGKIVSGGDKCFWRKGYLALESEGAPVEFRNVRIKELPSTGATAEESAPLDQGWKHLYNGVDFRGWKVPAGSEARWKASNWNLKYEPGSDKKNILTWDDAGIYCGEIIIDFQLPNSKRDTPYFGLCIRGETQPIAQVGVGPELSPINFGDHLVKPGEWYRLYLRIDSYSKTLTAHLTDKQNTHIQFQQTPLKTLTPGKLSIICYEEPVTFANIYLCENLSNWNTGADRVDWHWDERLTSPLRYNFGSSSDKYTAQFTTIKKDSMRLQISILDGDRVAYTWSGHLASVFRIVGDRLYYALFHPSASGGSIIAVDLSTGNQLWCSQLNAIGPVVHSAYNNMLNLSAGAETVSVYGDESLGQYFEQKRADNGETIAHKLFTKIDTDPIALSVRGAVSRFYEACSRGDLEEVKLLVNAGLSERAMRTEGYTRFDSALHEAARMGSANVVEYLLDRGFDPNATKQYNSTPLVLAAATAMQEMRMGNVNASPSYLTGMNTFQGALQSVHLLIQKDAKIPEDIRESLVQMAQKAKLEDLIKDLQKVEQAPTKNSTEKVR